MSPLHKTKALPTQNPVMFNGVTVIIIISSSSILSYRQRNFGRPVDPVPLDVQSVNHFGISSGSIILT
jgi:hypothetical protein